MIQIREVSVSDNVELQQLQGRCPQGVSTQISSVNIPSFFVRSDAYENAKVYVACDDRKIIGSAACAIRSALLNGTIRQIGYEFQYFVDSDCRGQGIARQLRRQIEQVFVRSGVELAYSLIMDGNVPSMRLFENEGFIQERTSLVAALMVRKKLLLSNESKIRSATIDDIEKIATLLNQTWGKYDLYTPLTAESLVQQIRRIPEFDLKDLFVLEENGAVQACLGAWDWSRVMRVTVERLCWNLRVIRWVLLTSKILPRFPQRGDQIHQIMLLLAGYSHPSYLGGLIQYINNIAFARGLDQMFYICRPEDDMLNRMRKFVRVNTKLHLYVKPLTGRRYSFRDEMYVSGFDL